jgi:chromosome segregation ATPase
MGQNSSRKIAVLGGILLLIAGVASGAPQQATVEPSAAAERASTLLAHIQGEAALLWGHADTLESLGRNMRISWRSHAEHLDRVKEHTNAVGKHIAELQAIHHEVLPWQQQAIKEVTSHAAGVATSAEAAINHLRENRNLSVPEYREHLTTIADHSEDMKQTVDNFRDYEKTHRELQQLEDELELAGG